MKKIRICFFSVALASIMGCGSPPSQHPVTLIFPSYDCSHAAPPCVPYAGCYLLGITWINVTVGREHSEETKIGCPSELSAPYAKTNIYYQPGQDSYSITASYGRKGVAVEINAGPFGEDESDTPWSINLE